MSLKILVTGGGTGGHIFPALEVAKLARLAGHDVRYFGSYRGQERAACAAIHLPFKAFHVGPVYKPVSIRGARSVIKLLVASSAVTKSLRGDPPNVILGTGGYSSAPVMLAAKKCRLPTVIHEQNSVPGRTQLMAAKTAFRVCTVFEGSAKRFGSATVVRTGMPVRSEFRAATNRQGTQILVMGGSQGSQTLNEEALATAGVLRPGSIEWFHITGKENFEHVKLASRELPSNVPYSVEAYLDGKEMAAAMAGASVAVCRSGAGTIAELAATRVPSVLVPYKFAFGDHQRVNAEEMTALGGATIVAQDNLTPQTLSSALEKWLDDPAACQSAGDALARWDLPDAAERILAIMVEAAN